jgi:transcriptional regulator with XRE-family HTH domain
MTEFGRRFRLARQLAGYSQADVAAVCLKPNGEPLSRASISQWESGATIPELPYLISAARFLGTSIDVLTGLRADTMIADPYEAYARRDPIISEILGMLARVSSHRRKLIRDIVADMPQTENEPFFEPTIPPATRGRKNKH